MSQERAKTEVREWKLKMPFGTKLICASGPIDKDNDEIAVIEKEKVLQVLKSVKTQLRWFIQDGDIDLIPVEIEKLEKLIEALNEETKE